jgi:hypothetical protein
MTSRISLLSAVFAIGALAALPALAEGNSAAPSPVSPAPKAETIVTAPGVQASTDVHADVKKDAHKDKLTKSKKAHEQVAAHPAPATKPGTSAPSMSTESTGTATTAIPSKTEPSKP